MAADRVSVPEGLSPEGLEAALEESRDAFLATASRVTPGRWSGTAFENGWTARELLAHVASIEWTYPALIRLAEQAPERGPAGAGPGIDEYNRRQVGKRRDAQVPELLDEFARNRARTIEAVRAVAERGLWDAHVRSAAGHEGPLLAVMWRVAVEHVGDHTRDLLRATRGSEADGS
jgi:uncharacterized protein (TIGR03083 family)